MIGVSTASAEEFVVTNGDSSGPGSLRQAVLDANGNGNPGVVDTITFNKKVDTITQDDLDALESTGPLHVTQSVAIVGPGRDQLTIDGKFLWINHSGSLNNGYPDSSSSRILITSGYLFEVGTFGDDNSAIQFSLTGVTVTGTNGVLNARGGVQASLLDLSVRGNATSSKYGLGPLISAGKGSSLEIFHCSITENSIGEHHLIEGAGSTWMLDCLVNSNSIREFDNGLWFAGDVGDVLEITSCGMHLGRGQIVAWAKENYISNSILSNTEEGYTAVLASLYNLHLRNVTIQSSRIIPHKPGIDEPSHLTHADGDLTMANTVLAGDGPPTTGTTYMPFMWSDKALLWNSHNHVDDGSLTGAAIGPALLDSNARPMTGSPLIDAGDDAQAINPRPPVEDLEFDLHRDNRISGVSVDIGAVETQAFFAINDEYTTPENTPLIVPAPGVLLNDTYDDPGTLKDNAIKIFGGPQHGGIDADDQNGGFIYVPNTDFYGTDTFQYIAQFTDPVGIMMATVTITVEPVDHPPVANPDSYETVEGQTLVVAAPGVLGNDTDPDNLPPTAPNAGLTALLVSGPSVGTLDLAPDGSFSYIPGAPGNYVFTYKAVDPEGARASKQ